MDEVQIEEIEREPKQAKFEEVEEAEAAAEDEAPKPDEADELADGDEHETELKKMAKETKDLSCPDRLQKSKEFRETGNALFKQKDLGNAGDAYVRSVIYVREVAMQSPAYYPDMEKNGSTPELFQEARDVLGKALSNLALVQLKMAQAGNPAMYEEVLSTANEALKLDNENVKVLFRRGAAQAALGNLRMGQDPDGGVELLRLAEADMRGCIKQEPQNREAREELQHVLQALKRRAREEDSAAKKVFSFGSALSAKAKPVDLFGDGSAMKRLEDQGDGGTWWNKDWLSTKDVGIVVTVRYELADAAGKFHGVRSELRWVLGSGAMHAGFEKLVPTMTVGEVARLECAPHRTAADTTLTRWLPARGRAGGSDTTVWEVALVSYRVYSARGATSYAKEHEEGFGSPADSLSTVHAHWKVVCADGTTAHTSKIRPSVNSLLQGGTLDDDDTVEPEQFEPGDPHVWAPLSAAVAGLRRGARVSVLLKSPPAPPQERDQVALVRLKQKHTAGQLDWCELRIEVEDVQNDAAQPTMEALVTERFRAEQRRVAGDDAKALERFRRAVEIGVALEDDAARRETDAARSALAWILARRAYKLSSQPSVSSVELSRADKFLEEASAALDAVASPDDDAFAARAMLLIAQDDLEGADGALASVVGQEPSDRVPEVRTLLRQEREAARRAGETQAVQALLPRMQQSATAVEAIAELVGMNVRWETLMNSKAGAVLRELAQSPDEQVATAAKDAIDRLTEQSKQQRPMW